MTSINDTKAPQGFASRVLARVKEKLATDQLLCQPCVVDDWNLERMPTFVALWDAPSGKNPIFSGPR